MNFPDHVRHWLDGASAVVMFGTLLGYLPAATAALTFVYMSVRTVHAIHQYLRWRRGEDDSAR